MWAVVGLGNPGKEYEQTRHNVGFLCVKRMAREWKIQLRKRICSSRAGLVKRENEDVLLALPQTYMNNSGRAVRQILETKGVKPERLIVVYDDVDILLGDIRVRKEGSAGSHKGMSSIIREVRTSKFPRIRIGIGPLASDRDVTDYVLSPFSEEERAQLKGGLAKASLALALILDGQLEKAMNEFNKRQRL